MNTPSSGGMRLVSGQPGQARRVARFAVAKSLMALLSFGALDCAAQSRASHGGAWTLTLENDAPTGSDNNYTNGMGLTWVSKAIDTYDERSFVRRWGESWSFLPFVGKDGYRTYVSWSLAQEMHTPDDIKVANPPRDDQPYAGVLYLDNVVYARGERSTHAWQLRVGMVGPSSRADSVQRWWHKAIDADKPMGWDTQLPNELVVNVGYTGAYLLAQGNLGKSASWRLVPVANVGLGNYCSPESFRAAPSTHGTSNCRRLRRSASRNPSAARSSSTSRFSFATCPIEFHLPLRVRTQTRAGSHSSRFQ